MKPDYTDIIVVLDRSGSMESIKNDMVNGLKNFIAEQKRLPGQCLLTLIQFDTQGYDTVFEAKPISNVPNIELVPRGGTPLLDAIGRAINETGKRFKDQDDKDRPEFVIMLVITDGEENSSREFTKAKIKEMIQHQTDKYKWNFVYLGANQDAFQEGASIGIAAFQSMTYHPSAAGINAMYTSVSEKTAMLRSKLSSSVAFDANDYKAQDDAKDQI